MSQPTTIVIIAQQKVWEAAQQSKTYTQSTIDSTLAEVGFIHCSFPNQTLEIANRRFADRDGLVLLFIDPTKVHAPVKYEGALSGRAGTFPHIYGPLNTDAVYASAPLQKQNGRFVAPPQLNKLAQQRTEEIIIVNEQDEVIGCKPRDLVALEDIYRVSALWVTNSKGDILLAQRAQSKHHHPGKWGPAVAGTIEKDESYDDNIVKEAAEEIGLQNIKPSKSKKMRTTPATGDHNHFTQWYTLVVDKPASDFVVRQEEVAQVKWFTRDELQGELRDHPQNYLQSLSWPLQNL